jgi:hypothetical protein
VDALCWRAAGSQAVRGVRYGVDERRLEPGTNEVGSGELGFDVYSCIYIYTSHNLGL